MMNLSQARLIGHAMDVLGELRDLAQDEIEAHGSGTAVRQAIYEARQHLQGAVYEAAYTRRLPADLEPHVVLTNQIPVDLAEDTNSEQPWGNLRDDRDHWKKRVIALRKIMIDNGLPTDCDVDEGRWLDEILKQGREYYEASQGPD